MERIRVSSMFVAALEIFAARACVGIAGSFYAIIGDSLLLGMD